MPPTLVSEPRQRSGLLRLWLTLVAAAALAGCASAGSDGPVGKTLEFLGLKAPQSVDDTKALLPQQRKVTVRVHAGDQLNTDPQMRSLSVVMRVYRLRRSEAFLAAPYSAFQDADAEKKAFGTDLVDVREIVMRPGQRHEVVETLPLETSYIAVVALFRAPAEGRWRFVFDAKQAEASGLTLGLHGCAISVATGVPEQAAPVPAAAGRTAWGVSAASRGSTGVRELN
jgi:type VI secretion system protein VasD